MARSCPYCVGRGRRYASSRGLAVTGCPQCAGRGRVAPAAYDASLADEFLETEAESAGWHRSLGRGRSVSQLGEVETLEVPVGGYHASLGRGRQVSRMFGEAEMELVGNDNRQPVSNTTDVPFRWMCALDLLFPDPDKPSKFLAFRGSGTLISPRHVLTAGHCLFDEITGSAKKNRRVLEVAQVRAVPGCNGSY